MAIDRFDVLVRRVAKLEQQVAQLIRAGAVPVPFAERAEAVAEAFDRLYRIARTDEDALEMTGKELADDLGIDCSPVALGRALSMMGLSQDVKKRNGKSVRLYRVVKLEACKD